MKLFVVLCALAAVALSATVTEKLDFKFANGDGVVDQLFTLPFAYAGSVNVSIDGTTESDVLLCIHWVVPAVAPFGDVQLDKIWEVTCTSFFTASAGEPFAQTNVLLRSGESYLSAALSNFSMTDIDSSGIIETSDYDFSATITYQSCDDGMFGADCSKPYSDLSFAMPTNVTISGDTPLYFALPTQDVGADTNTLELFASSLEFSFETFGTSDNIDYTLNYRLMGSPEEVNDGDECRSSSSCKIENPPFTATPDYMWGVSVSTSEAVSCSVAVSLSFCDKGMIGADCEDYTTLDTAEVGEVKKYSKRTVFVFDSSVSVAVGGLDGYEQQKTAPDVNVQIDAEPFDDDEYNVLLSEGAEANVAIIDMTATSPDSKIVLSVNPSKSFGIWIVDDTTHCPQGCSDHGSCNSQEFVCVCDPSDDYEDLDCGHEVKDFTIEYIILIAVGVILIAAILIGVPVYCYLNRNQEYDIVA